MPLLALPSPYPYSDGDELSVSLYDTLLWDTDSPNTSLLIVNGLLDEDNFASSFSLAHELFQRGAQVEVFGAAGTANLDYKYYWFGDYDYVTAVDQDTDPIQPIPGGNVTVNCKWAVAGVLVMFTVMWKNDNAFSNDVGSSIVFMVDGAYTEPMRREMRNVAVSFADPAEYQRGRVWCGHVTLPLTRGVHTIGLGLLADKDIQQTRIHAVSIEVLMFKALTASDLTA
jgi:hypothetical protein